MKFEKISLSILCILLSPIPSYLLSYGMDGNVEKSIMDTKPSPGVWLWFFMASLISFTAWCLSKQAHVFSKQLKIGVGGSYLGFLLLFLLCDTYHGQLGITIMWAPIHALFVILIMVPCVALNWLAGSLLFGFGETETRDQPSGPPNRRTPSASVGWLLLTLGLIQNDEVRVETKNGKIRIWRNLIALSLLLQFAGSMLISFVLGGKGDALGLTPITTIWLGVIIFHVSIGLSIVGIIILASTFRFPSWITVVSVILLLLPLVNLLVASVFIIYATWALRREAQQSDPSNPHLPSAQGANGR